MPCTHWALMELSTSEVLSVQPGCQCGLALKPHMVRAGFVSRMSSTQVTGSTANGSRALGHSRRGPALEAGREAGGASHGLVSARFPPLRTARNIRRDGSEHENRRQCVLLEFACY